MELEAFEPTDEHRRNLEALAQTLREGVTGLDFDMGNYFKTEYNFLSPAGAVEAMSTPCGAAACALGYTPAAIPEQFLEHVTTYPGYGWESVSMALYGTPMSSAAGRWFFSEEWNKVDNTPEGAATRIEYALLHGKVPAVDTDFSDMRKIYQQTSLVNTSS